MQETTFCEIIELERIPWQHTDSPQSEESFISTAISFTQGKIHLVYLVLLMIRDLFGPHSALTLIDELPSLCKLKFWSLSVSVSLFSWCSLKCIICSFFFARTNEKNRLREYSFWNTHFLNQPSYSYASSSTTSTFLFGSRLLELKARMHAQ